MAQFLSFSIGNGGPSPSSSLSLSSSLSPPVLQMCSHAAGSGSLPPSNIVFFMTEEPSVLLPAAVRLCACVRLKKAGFALIQLSSLPFSHLLLHQDVLGPPLLCRPAASRVTKAEPLSSVTVPAILLQGLWPLVLPQAQNLSVQDLPI